MKANELRIGNFIYYGANERVLDTLLFLQLLKYTTIFEPIPLTKEWLLRFGFVEFVDFGNKTGMYDKMPLCGFSYSVNNKKVMILQKGNSVSHWIDAEIQYVHQLQNLYFALTGEELTIKEAAQ